MTQEDKELLLKDLCARLPYGVFCSMGLDYPLPLQRLFIDKLDGILLDFYEDGKDYQVYLSEVKPYLRPMSSITEEEKEELLNLLFDKEAKYFYIDKEGLIDGKTSNLMKEGLNYPAFCPINVEIYTDYLNAHHFDWRTDSNGRTLIEKGLALEAKEGLYKLKEK